MRSKRRKEEGNGDWKVWKWSLVCASVCVSLWVRVGRCGGEWAMDPSNGPIEAPVRSGTLQQDDAVEGAKQLRATTTQNLNGNGLRSSINDSSITLAISVSQNSGQPSCTLFGRFPVPYAFKTSPHRHTVKDELETDEWVRLVKCGFRRMWEFRKRRQG